MNECEVIHTWQTVHSILSDFVLPVGTRGISVPSLPRACGTAPFAKIQKIFAPRFRLLGTINPATVNVGNGA